MSGRFFEDTAVDIPAVPVQPTWYRQGPARRFPGVKRWYGQATHSWWAIVPCPDVQYGARLVEAHSEDELAGKIGRALEGAAI